MIVRAQNSPLYAFVGVLVLYDERRASYEGSNSITKGKGEKFDTCCAGHYLCATTEAIPRNC